MTSLTGASIELGEGTLTVTGYTWLIVDNTLEGAGGSGWGLSGDDPGEADALDETPPETADGSTPARSAAWGARPGARRSGAARAPPKASVSGRART